ncbi:hypothetical protein EV122DRAFT_285707 [Schizophyllum commune]
MFIWPFHVASSAPLHPLPKVKTPLPLKQHILVRRATVSLALNAFPLRPSPHMRSPSRFTASSPTPLGVEATYRRPPSKGPPHSQHVPPSPPPPTRPPSPYRVSPLGVEATPSSPFSPLSAVGRR